MKMLCVLMGSNVRFSQWKETKGGFILPVSHLTVLHGKNCMNCLLSPTDTRSCKVPPVRSLSYKTSSVCVLRVHVCLCGAARPACHVAENDSLP